MPSRRHSRGITAHDSFIIPAAGNESAQQRGAGRRMKESLNITGSVTNNQTEGRGVAKIALQIVVDLVNAASGGRTTHAEASGGGGGGG